MKPTISRRGSALLIVLGMMAFVMVSALAFSAYMRSARLPSSYLRRTSSSRLLVKAGMARAIDDIDRAVGNNPHPNVGGQTYGSLHNTWRHRVFMGTQGGSEVGLENTVTPLCLEALAYIPVPLVNEARYYSRRAPSAQWQSLDFDVGRFCYCALDVSDYFDVNRMLADTPRSSSPQRRVSMAYLFENDSHKGSGAGGAAWDNFMNQFRTIDETTLAVDMKGKDPLISLADFNLALGQKGSVAGFKSPFYDYVKSTGGRAGFYDTSSEADEEMYRRMTFVTDGWFPSGEDEYDPERQAEGGNAAIEKYDLNSGDNQPFAMEYLETEKPALSDVVLGKRLLSDSRMGWLEHLSGLGCAALYDYLDPDHVPISLAIPTTERIPMVCGIRPDFPGSKFTVKKTYEPGGEDEAAVNQVGGDGVTTKIVEKSVLYRIDPNDFVAGFMGGDVKTLVVFPFAHQDENDGQFTMDGRFSMFFTSEQMGLRTGEATDVLHLATPMMTQTAVDPNTGVISVKLSDQGVGVTARIKREEDAVKELSNRLTEGRSLAPHFSQAGNELLKLTYRWTQTPEMSGSVKTGKWVPEFKDVWPNPGDKLVSAHCGLPALKANGTVDPDFTDAKLLALMKGGPTSGKKMILNAAVWLRIKDNKGKYVDMVPACLSDDKLQNNQNDPDPRIQIIGKQEFAGQPFPVMRFDTGVDFTLSVESLNGLTTKDVKLEPEGVICADPRFNFAPEHWFKQTGDMTAQTWIKNCEVGGNGRDDDIFMATSDAGYMQSPYEVAHLTRFTNLIKYGNSVSAGNMNPPDATKHTTFPDSFGKTANNHLAWMTYDPVDANYQAFEDLPWTSEGTGFKVNPYSDSTNILMAAFANTPIDWKRASTNDAPGTTDYASMNASEYNRRYAWNEYNSNETFAWDDLQRIAGRFSDLTRNFSSWKRAWREMDWYGDSDRFCDIDLSGDTAELWTSDRKFLYGYWHDCFATKQQLFLVFVRAEPMMMGSGAIRQIPPQLGSRAVALVWRDPRRTKEDGFPHQTRILFYRQFD